MEPLAAGPLRLQVIAAGDERRWVRAIDTTHPAIANPPQLPSYPLDAQWRVAARFDAFEQPKRLRVCPTCAADPWRSRPSVSSYSGSTARNCA